MFCIDFTPTDHSRLEHDLIYYFCYICSLEDKGIHTDFPQYFSVSVQGISFLTVQCTCFDNLPLEVNGACEFPDGCGKEGCVVNRPLYWQSDETFYWSLILRFQFTIPTWSLSHDFFPLVTWVYTTPLVNNTQNLISIIFDYIKKTNMPLEFSSTSWK